MKKVGRYLNALNRSFRVFVRKDQWSGSEFACAWLGHNTYKCGHCKKGFPKAWSEHNHDYKCPECDYFVFTKSEED